MSEDSYSTITEAFRNMSDVIEDVHVDQIFGPVESTPLGTYIDTEGGSSSGDRVSSSGGKGQQKRDQRFTDEQTRMMLVDGWAEDWEKGVRHDPESGYEHTCWSLVFDNLKATAYYDENGGLSGEVTYMGVYSNVALSETCVSGDKPMEVAKKLKSKARPLIDAFEGIKE